MMSKPIRVRIAPSPTGPLHMGTSRTALFNWIFAKQRKGTFIVRIEDTDRERSKPEFERDILDGLSWLGLEWDEGPLQKTDSANPEIKERGDYGPYRQSERGDIYEHYLKQLLDKQHAYWCFCTSEELTHMRESMTAQGVPPRYSGRCRNLAPENVKRRLAAGEHAALRFKTPETRIGFTDLVRGKVTFNLALIGDFVIARGIREPLYNFASVIDDAGMHISHVIRAEDHLPNTPKQLILQRTLELPPVHYAHLPLILNSDRSKMSKRYAETAVAEYRKAGYLPKALVNFLALLGWHPAGGDGEEQEFFSIKELVDTFNLDRVQRAGAIFNEQKLDWMNTQYLRRIETRDLLAQIRNLAPLPTTLSEEQLVRLVNVTRERMHRLGDFVRLTDFFFHMPAYDSKLIVWQHTTPEATLENLRTIRAALIETPEEIFTREQLVQRLTPISEKRGRGAVLWPLRVALSGRESSPDPFEIMSVLGRNETLHRIDRAIEKLYEAHHE